MTPPSPGESDGVRPMRIALVAACPFPANHGTPGAIRELADSLVRLGHEVHVVTYPQGDDTPLPGVRVHRAPSLGLRPSAVRIGPSLDRLVFDATMVPRLCQVIWRHRIDVVHAHNYEAAIAGTVACRITGRPLVYNGINSMADELPSYAFFRNKALALRLGRWLDRWVPRGADAVIALSDELKGYLESLGLPARRCLVMPLGVDVPLLAGGDAARVRGRFGLDTDVPVVMYTGSIEHFQRVDLLVSAFARVADRHPRAVLMIANNIGNADQRAALEAQARDLGVAQRMRFADAVPLQELKHYLAAADVAVVPRPSCPGFPVKLLNYMAASRAIVCVAGSAKSVCHGYDAYVARNDDAEDLAHGLDLLLADPALRAELGRRAFGSLQGVYDWDTVGRATAMVYDQVLQPGRRIDRLALSRYLKAAYTPSLAAHGGNAPGFLQPGPVVYPAFDGSST